MVGEKRKLPKKLIKIVTALIFKPTYDQTFFYLALHSRDKNGDKIGRQY